jgi:hypothetical protein
MECRLGELCIAGIVLILRATFWACSIGGGALSGIDGIVVAPQRSFQAAAWLFAGAILVLSLSPPSFRPTTGAANGLEHFMIFLGTGMAFAFGYPRQLRSLRRRYSRRRLRLCKTGYQAVTRGWAISLSTSWRPAGELDYRVYSCS